MKKVEAVKPYDRGTNRNFKMAPYEAWSKLGGEVAKSHYPPNILKGIFFNHEIPCVNINEGCARLRFCEAYSLSFDTFPDYAFYEVIPFIWDCWPSMIDQTCKWIDEHNVNTVFFTCKLISDIVRKRFQNKNIIYCPEGIDIANHSEGLELCNRTIDLFEFGRGHENLFELSIPSKYHFISNNVKLSDEQFQYNLENSKVTICLPHSLTDKEKTGGLETLTQRYWECMLSRMVIVGHAPKELIDLIGYNPVIEIPEIVDTKMTREHVGRLVSNKIYEVIDNIEIYQELVDNNRAIAIENGSWLTRIKFVMNKLKELEYKI